MKILSIDTSGLQAGAAIVDDHVTIGEITLNARTGEKSWSHSEILMPGIHQLFKLTGICQHQIDYVAYTNGPGSFTGLRIGAATALGLAKGMGKPAISVPTLDALAYNMLGAGGSGLVVPMMDARRG
ncbi:MAG: tRNA (adenosine(37)-N6)-threonylcarbamoyltransferase complex dimerization subunit type 1 TsaB, partial [Defluviitaleaceae bacterium]|nr:tRNA (adenosine(37)-N6)-threonylcarbamoyltransferase complex dimerization subunit type 1 TsaB [Defluviitaleaceae bacterium]